MVVRGSKDIKLKCIRVTVREEIVKYGSDLLIKKVYILSEHSMCI